MEEEEDDDLSLSRFVNQQPSAASRHNSTILIEDGRGQTTSEKDGLARLADVMETFSRGQSNAAATLEKMATIMEDHKKVGVKRRSEEKDTDEIILVEKTITVKDDGHEIIDHKVGHE